MEPLFYGNLYNCLPSPTENSKLPCDLGTCSHHDGQCGPHSTSFVIVQRRRETDYHTGAGE